MMLPTLCWVLIEILFYNVYTAQSEDITCIGKYVPPYANIEIKDKLFSPLLCENCDQKPEYTVLMNNGHQLLIKMMYRDTHNVPTLVGGILEDKGTYRFKEIYFS